MIEVPRGALTADEIAEHAEFFSFGTNDLTQMTFGYSRDDAEGGFLLAYVERSILPANPFQTLDDAGVGQMRSPSRRAAPRPDLEIGICGEHGGDPASIAFFDESASTTCPARRSACRSPGWPRPRPRSRAPNATSSPSISWSRMLPGHLEAPADDRTDPRSDDDPDPQATTEEGSTR